MKRQTLARAGASDNSSADAWRVRSLRVLVVDDNALFRSELTSFLGELGVLVVGSAATGAEALDMARSLEPDLVLMDLELPVMNGLEATRRLRSGPRAPVVIIVSIYDDPHNVSASAQAGAACLVGKSTLVDGLPAALGRVCAERTVISPGRDATSPPQT